MIGYNHLGKNGRFGNQMFQYAALKGIAKKNGYEFCIPPGPRVEYDFDDEENQHKLLMAFEMPNVKEVNMFAAPYRKEASANFDKDLFENCEDNVNLYGFFQSEKYFKHIEDEIREDFTFDAELVKSCKEFLEYTFVFRDVIALHIRRGDYISNPNHPSQPMEYYQRALEMLPDLDVIVFSDDAEWCKQQEIFASDRFSISEGNTTDADLCLMSLCQYHIIANSSFSWWGAWLAKSKKVIAPKNWFGGDCVNKDVSDMEFANWTWV